MDRYSIVYLVFVVIITVGEAKHVRIEQEENTQLEESDSVSKQSSFLEWLAQIVGSTTTSTTTTTTTPAPIIPKNCEKCECGLTNKKNRIVGGQETQVNEYPWVAQLIYAGRFYCGGTLINDRYVLTAGHCLTGFNKDRVIVRILDHDRAASSASRIERKIEKVTIHSGYHGGTYNNDIALLLLNQTVEMGNLARPACLPTPGLNFSGHIGIVTGWGATKENGQTSNTLREVSVPIMSNNECRRSSYGPARITDNMLCAGYKHGQKDSCQGDSGGPLHVIQSGFHQVAGIVSWGEGCAQPDNPGVYTRVNRYITWIKSNTKDACYC